MVESINRLEQGMISAIVPSYKNPQCLDICLRSFIDTSNQELSEIICIIDGFTDLYKNICSKYNQYHNVKFILSEHNRGMPFALNIGVYSASQPYVFIINDDNVFPKNWDSKLLGLMKENYVVSPNQIEANDSIFHFFKKDFGSVDNFRYQEFLDTEPSFRIDEPLLTNDGEIFPFCISKKAYMAVGGFDVIYPSPFICDWDFFLKLELLNYSFFRTRCINFYHFGSISTKKAIDSNDSIHFHQSENIAHQIFVQKWGFPPTINRPINSHKPQTKETIKGIKYHD